MGRSELDCIVNKKKKDGEDCLELKRTLYKHKIFYVVLWYGCFVISFHLLNTFFHNNLSYSANF